MSEGQTLARFAVLGMGMREVRGGGKKIKNSNASVLHAFVLRGDQDPKVCLTAFKDFKPAYQPAADTLKPVPALR